MTSNTQKVINYKGYYKEGDKIMNQTEFKASGYRPAPSTFFLTQPSGFNGYCTNTLGIALMKDIDHDNSCVQVITDLKTAAVTHLNYKTYYSINFKD